MTTGEGPGDTSVPPPAAPGDAAGLLGIQPLLEHDPTEIGPYTLIGRLGKGGTGVAFLAKSPEGEWVVVKAIWPHLAEDAEQIARTFREAEALKAISSPRISRLLDTSAAGPRPWFAMEYVLGVNLKEYVESHGPLDPIQLIVFADGLAAAIADVHAAGVVHRDIKPANIVMAPSGPRIIDFGVAHFPDATQVTVSGSAVGTPAWMAPEQLARDSVSPATDVHAWALNVIYAGTAQEPFRGATYADTTAKVVWSDPEVPNSLPASLRLLVTSALAKDPRSRPTIAEIHSAIEAGGPPSNRVDSEQMPARPRRRSLIPLAVVVGVLAALVIAVPALSFIVANSGDDTGTASSAAPEMRASESGAVTLNGLAASATPSPVTVGEPFSITAVTSPLLPEVAMRVEQLVRDAAGAQWETVAEIVSDAEGRGEWTARGAAEAGPVVYRVASDLPDGATVTSPTISVSITRLDTASVKVKWPSKPAGHCEEQVISVYVSPAEPGRTVLLQYTRNERSWKTATEATLDVSGKGRLRTPGCDSPAGQKRDEFTWRALAPQTEAYSEQSSRPGTLSMCPGEGPVPVSFREVYRQKWEITVTNPSPLCYATVRITAGINCETGPLPEIGTEYVGTETSASYVVNPGEASTFSDSQRWDGGLFSYEACRSYPYNGPDYISNVTAYASGYDPA